MLNYHWSDKQIVSQISEQDQGFKGIFHQKIKIVTCFSSPNLYEFADFHIFGVPQNKETHAGLEQHEGRVTNNRIFIFRETIPLKVEPMLLCWAVITGNYGLRDMSTLL